MPTAYIYINVAVYENGTTRHVEYSIKGNLALADERSLLDQCKQAMADHLSVARWLEGKTVLSAIITEAHYRDSNDIYREII